MMEDRKNNTKVHKEKVRGKKSVYIFKYIYKYARQVTGSSKVIWNVVFKSD